MLKILIICGTRPEIIKLAPVYHRLKNTGWANPIWLHTGQHDEMAKNILECFAITPDITLQREGASLSEFSINLRAQIDRILEQDNWDLTIIQGDTESAFIGALSSFYQRVPIAHIEAGLRTYDLNRPFPEEGLRQMITRIATFNFAPTNSAADALLKEGISPARICVTGNTVIDAQQWIIHHHHIIPHKTDRKQLLITLHRRENWGIEIEHACLAIRDIANSYPNIHTLFPVHLNPTVNEPIHQLLSGIPNIHLLPPLGYLEMQQAIADSWLILTDSGGIQEEAPTFSVPVLVLRTETERPEAINAGCAKIIGTSPEKITGMIHSLLANDGLYKTMQATQNPFGDGKASERIVQFIHSQVPEYKEH